MDRTAIMEDRPLMTWSRPARLASYSAWSASRISALGRSPRVGRIRQRRDGFADRFGNVQGAGQLGVGEQGDKLLAAVAGGGVARPAHLAGDAFSDAAQDVVAHLVAVVVIVQLEMVDIEHQHGDRGLMPGGAAPFTLQRFLEGAAVGDAR
jgi:hypothetical protein